MMINFEPEKYLNKDDRRSLEIAKQNIKQNEQNINRYISIEMILTRKAYNICMNRVD